MLYPFGDYEAYFYAGQRDKSRIYLRIDFAAGGKLLFPGDLFWCSQQAFCGGNTTLLPDLSSFFDASYARYERESPAGIVPAVKQCALVYPAGICHFCRWRGNRLPASSVTLKEGDLHMGSGPPPEKPDITNRDVPFDPGIVTKETSPM